MPGRVGRLFDTVTKSQFKNTGEVGVIKHKSINSPSNERAERGFYKPSRMLPAYERKTKYDTSGNKISQEYKNKGYNKSQISQEERELRQVKARIEYEKLQKQRRGPQGIARALIPVASISKAVGEAQNYQLKRQQGEANIQKSRAQLAQYQADQSRSEFVNRGYEQMQQRQDQQQAQGRGFGMGMGSGMGMFGQDPLSTSNATLSLNFGPPRDQQQAPPQQPGYNQSGYSQPSQYPPQGYSQPAQVRTVQQNPPAVPQTGQSYFMRVRTPYGHKFVKVRQ